MAWHVNGCRCCWHPWTHFACLCALQAAGRKNTGMELTIKQHQRDRYTSSNAHLA